MKKNTLSKLNKTFEVRRIVVWSNLAFVIPLGLSLNTPIYLILILSVFVVSTVSHVRSSKFLDFLDYALASILIFANLILIFSVWTFDIIRLLAIGFGFVGIGLFVIANRKFYYLYHSLFHITSGLISLLCLIASNGL